jgi:4-diphosphocytidyl-2-C-methyl-D-erythritol kinase
VREGSGGFTAAGAGSGGQDAAGAERASGASAGVAAGGTIRARRSAPAKLNLTLAVVGRREDGYHALHSVMVPLGLSDVIALAWARQGASGDTLRIAGLPLPAAGDNLVLRAIAATRAAVLAAAGAAAGAASLSPLAARLTKRIPVAAGLGGGSSDAAATVAAALEAWGASLPFEAVREIALSLGSDVPFFLAGGAALVTGRGEDVDPLPDPAGDSPGVLLVTPRVPVSTSAVFAAYAGGVRPASAAALAASDRLAADLRAGLPAAELQARSEELATANDLIPAALEVAPGLAEFRAALGRLVGRPVGQSGSGPTAWVLYPSLAAARVAARFVRLGIANGALPRLGDGEPFVAASTIIPGELHAAPSDLQNGGRTSSKGR